MLVNSMSMLARSDSMDVSNDPRFFGGNILDKRLTAFAGLGTISGLLVGTAMDQVYGMSHDFHIIFSPTAMDYCKFLTFVFMTFVFYFNMISTYVSVAQIYHCYRLMTAGPTGFEGAKLYYLNPNVAFYRHFAIKGMLNSLWMFLMGTAFRLWVKFSNDAVETPLWVAVGVDEPGGEESKQPTFEGLTILGGVVAFVYFAMGASLYFIHSKHVAVFRERYHKLEESEQPLLDTIARGRRAGAMLDV